MPYIDDVNNEKKYIPSKYAKEELPTWNEIYNEFFKEKAWWYDPMIESHQLADLYWEIPHRKMLLGWIANQFNKILFEDGAKERMLAYLNSQANNPTVIKMTDIHFMILENEIDIEPQVDASLNDNFPLIYTCEIPSTKQRSIFASNLPSKNIKDFKSIIQLSMIVKDENGNIDRIECDVDNEKLFWDLITELIKDVIVYFEGNFVGWKDENGEALTGPGAEFKPGCGYQSGIDAGI